jgi:hypothetical protein
MYLLFLDIDGVLNPVTAPDGALLSKLPLLEAWLRSRPTWTSWSRPASACRTASSNCKPTSLLTFVPLRRP